MLIMINLLKLKSITLEVRIGKLLKGFFFCKISMLFFLNAITVMIRTNAEDKQVCSFNDCTWLKVGIYYSLILDKWNRDSIFLSPFAFLYFTDEKFNLNNTKMML